MYFLYGMSDGMGIMVNRVVFVERSPPYWILHLYKYYDVIYT